MNLQRVLKKLHILALLLAHGPVKSQDLRPLTHYNRAHEIGPMAVVLCCLAQSKSSLNDGCRCCEKSVVRHLPLRILDLFSDIVEGIPA